MIPLRVHMYRHVTTCLHVQVTLTHTGTYTRGTCINLIDLPSVLGGGTVLV